MVGTSHRRTLRERPEIKNIPYHPLHITKSIHPAGSSSSADTTLLSLDLLARLGEVIGELLLGSGREDGGGPEVGGEEAIGLAERRVDGHGEVASRSGVSGGGRVDVLHARHGEQLLGDEGGHDARPSGRGDETHAHGAALAGDLAGHGVRQTGVVAPVAAADGHDVHLGVDDASANGARHLLGGLQTESDVTIAISHSNVALESGALSGSGLLLDGHDLHDLVLDAGEKRVHDLVLLDGQREEEDLLNAADLAVLHQTPELGDGDPLILVALVSSSSPASSLVSSPASLPAPTATTTKTSSLVTSCVSHNELLFCVSA